MLKKSIKKLVIRKGSFNFSLFSRVLLVLGELENYSVNEVDFIQNGNLL